MFKQSSSKTVGKGGPMRGMMELGGGYWEIPSFTTSDNGFWGCNEQTSNWSLVWEARNGGGTAKGGEAEKSIAAEISFVSISSW